MEQPKPSAEKLPEVSPKIASLKEVINKELKQPREIRIKITDMSYGREYLMQCFNEEGNCIRSHKTRSQLIPPEFLNWLAGAENLSSVKLLNGEEVTGENKIELLSNTNTKPTKFKWDDDKQAIVPIE